MSVLGEGGNLRAHLHFGSSEVPHKSSVGDDMFATEMMNNICLIQQQKQLYLLVAYTSLRAAAAATS